MSFSEQAYYFKNDPNIDNGQIKLYRVIGDYVLPAGAVKKQIAAHLVAYQHINDEHHVNQIYVRDAADFMERMLPFPPPGWNESGRVLFEVD